MRDLLANFRLPSSVQGGQPANQLDRPPATPKPLASQKELVERAEAFKEAVASLIQSGAEPGVIVKNTPDFSGYMDRAIQEICNADYSQAFRSTSNAISVLPHVSYLQKDTDLYKCNEQLKCELLDFTKQLLALKEHAKSKQRSR